MRRDKKVQGGAMRFVLIDRLGHALVRSDVSDADVLDAVKRAR
jgi:3-dehydroquinate synthetase